MDIDSDEFKKLKKEIALKHGYKLDDNDPILMFVTLNDYMLKQYKEALDYNLQDLSDILVNIKGDVNQYVKENEVNLLKRIQEINNNNVIKVHNKIKEYFQHEAEINKQLRHNNNKNSRLLLNIVLFNTLCNLLILLLLFIKYL